MIVLPLLHRRARAHQHLAAELADESGFLGERDERYGSKLTAFGMAPPGQRLDADDAAGTDLHDGLIVIVDLTQSEAASQIAFHLEAVDDGGVHLVLEDHEA